MFAQLALLSLAVFAPLAAAHGTVSGMCFESLLLIVSYRL